MRTIPGHNIIKFHTYVREQLEILHSKRQETSDLVVNLFKGYEEATDLDFTSYMKDWRSEWEDGSHPYKHTEIMALAKSKNRLLVTQELWEKPTRTDKQLIMMEIQVEDLTRNLRNANRNLRRNHGL